MPWVKRTYDVNDIIEANIERPYKRSTSLRITTRDFKTKLYPAGSLRQKHWNTLRKKLEELRINFVNLPI